MNPPSLVYALTTHPEEGQCSGDLHEDKNKLGYLLLGQISPTAWLQAIEEAVTQPSLPSVTFEKKKKKRVTAIEFCGDRGLPACGRMCSEDLRAVPLPFWLPARARHLAVRLRQLGTQGS